MPKAICRRDRPPAGMRPSRLVEHEQGYSRFSSGHLLSSTAMVSTNDIRCNDFPCHVCRYVIQINCLRGDLTMNRVPLARRVQIINCLVEGNSIRSTERMTGT